MVYSWGESERGTAGLAGLARSSKPHERDRPKKQMNRLSAMRCEMFD